MIMVHILAKDRLLSLDQFGDQFGDQFRDQSRKQSEDLFEFANTHSRTDTPETGPLAHRMRPKTLDEFVGQERVLGPGKPLRLWISKDQVPSLIFWGPPGCGKTTLAQIIAQQTQSEFQFMSAVLAGVKEIKAVVQQAK